MVRSWSQIRERNALDDTSSVRPAHPAIAPFPTFFFARRVEAGDREDTPAQVQDRQKPGSGLLSAQRASVRLHFQPRSREKLTSP